MGDEAILQSIIEQLRRSLPVEITVFSKDPKDTLERYSVERAVSVRTLSRDEILPEIKRLDLFILGGGGILFDGEVKQYLREVTLAHESGVPAMVYAVGVGPLRDPVNQEMVRASLEKAAALTVRENLDRKVLEEAGVHREILITADPALLLNPEPLPPQALRQEGLEGKARLIGMSVREPGPAAPDINEDVYHALLANAADYMVDRYDADVVFVPMERKVLDMQHSHAVISKMLWPQRATVLKMHYTPGKLLSLMKHFVFAVGMRLHFLIFAALQGIPFVALPYASKVTGFLQELQMETPPLQLVNSGRLIAYIDRSWDQRKVLQARINRKLPALRERALETNRIAVSLLKKRYSEKM
jgi:polysaccharide pyruvyl transferase CsaB